MSFIAFVVVNIIIFAVVVAVIIRNGCFDGTFLFLRYTMPLHVSQNTSKLITSGVEYPETEEVVQ